VREIALSHRADVTLATGAGGRGTLLRVTFPRASAAADSGNSGGRRVAA